MDWGTSPTWAWTGGLVSCDSRFDLSRVDLDRSQAVESAPRTIPKLCWGRVQEGRVSGWAGGGVVDWGTCGSWTGGLGSELVRPVLGVSGARAMGGGAWAMGSGYRVRVLER